MTFPKRTLVALLAALLFVAFHAEEAQAQKDLQRTVKENSRKIARLNERLDKQKDLFESLDDKMEHVITLLTPGAKKGSKKQSERTAKQKRQQNQTVNDPPQKTGCQCACCCVTQPEVPEYKGGVDTYELCCEGSTPVLIVSGYFYECEEVCYEVEGDGCYELALKRCAKYGYCSQCHGALVPKVCKFPVKPVWKGGYCVVCVIAGDDSATWVKLDCQPTHPQMIAAAQ